MQGDLLGEGPGGNPPLPEVPNQFKNLKPYQIRELSNLIKCFGNTSIDLKVFVELTNSLHKISQTLPNVDTISLQQDQSLNPALYNVAEDFAAMDLKVYEQRADYNPHLSDDELAQHGSVDSPKDESPVDQTEGTPTRPSTPDFEIATNEFEEMLFKSQQLIPGTETSHQSRPLNINEFARSLVLAYNLLNQRKISNVDGLSIIGKVITKNKNAININLADGSVVDIKPYLVEVFCSYRKFYNSPAGLSKLSNALRSGMIMGGNLGVVAKTKVPKTMPSTIRFAATIIGQKLSKLFNTSPNQN